ncbi:uncharacterized protein LOC107871908 [Capsicum annuum]|uniref:uncharacterized protein LOC107871908 n=1 Tax=Capsicum annuum TaxID=4072 RepID=UPI0007BF5742|nr:uncharacterized protein LOC107871908 [Capsicum annuum]
MGSWNIRTLQGKLIELVKILRNRRINTACVQETKWVGSKARDVDGYKLWYTGSERYKNGVGILVDKELRWQVGLDEEEKKRFWVVLDEVVGFGFEGRNDERAALLDFTRAFGLVVVNSYFAKKKKHPVTFRSRLTKTKIEFLLLKKGDRSLCKDCVVIPTENLMTQHALLAMDLVIKSGIKSRGGEGSSRVRYGGLTSVSALEIGGDGVMGV